MTGDRNLYGATRWFKWTYKDMQNVLFLYFLLASLITCIIIITQDENNKTTGEQFSMKYNNYKAPTLYLDKSPRYTYIIYCVIELIRGTWNIRFSEKQQCIIGCSDRWSHSCKVFWVNVFRIIVFELSTYLERILNTVLDIFVFENQII